MLRREFELTKKEEIEEILKKGKIVHVALCDKDQPYVLPMNYGYEWESKQLVLYLHGGKKGYKYEVMKNNPKVCFEISCDFIPYQGKVACQYGMSYSCIIGKGVIEFVEEQKVKAKALSCLMKIQTGKEDFSFDEKLTSIVQVIKITTNELTAKRRPLPPVSFQ